MPYAKIIYVFGFLSICQSASLPEPVSPVCRQFCQSTSLTGAPVYQSASFARAESGSFARAPVLPERQFCQSASFARAPVLPERQFRQSASFARVPAAILLDLPQVDLERNASSERERRSRSREVDLSYLQGFQLHFAPKM
jgi:hypothetical protein